MNIFKKIFKKAQGKKKTITIKTSKLDFIGKSQTIDILSEQEIDNKIQTSLGNNVARTNVDNDFSGTQTFEFAKVKRVPGNNQFEVINWGVFNTRATAIEQKNDQQDSILRNVPRLNGINQFTNTNTFERLRCKSSAVGDEEVIRLREFNGREENSKQPFYTAFSNKTNISSGDIDSYELLASKVWYYELTKRVRVSYDAQKIYQELASEKEKRESLPIKVKFTDMCNAFCVLNTGTTRPIGVADPFVVGTFPYTINKDTTKTIELEIDPVRGMLSGNPKTILTSVKVLIGFYKVRS